MKCKVSMKVGDMKKSHRYYRNESRRLQSWDYSTPGGYFVTICTHLKKPYFSKITNGKLRLSSIGKIVAEEWEKTGRLRKNVKLDEYILMPNHLHGIVILQEVVEAPRWGVYKERSIKPDALGSIIGQFKSACTRRIRSSDDMDFAWQSSYYDHIIRDENDLFRIRKYVRENPSKWALDKYYLEEKKT